MLSVPNWFWEALGFVGFITNIAGNLLLAYKHKGGWPIRLAPNICWAMYSIHFGNIALLANSLTFFVINCIGWYKWAPKTAVAFDRDEYIRGVKAGFNGRPCPAQSTNSFAIGYSDGMGFTDG